MNPPKIKTFPTFQPLHEINTKDLEDEENSEIKKQINEIFRFILKNYETFTFNQFLQMAQHCSGELLEKKAYFDSLVRRLEKEKKIIASEGWDEIIFKRI